MSFSLAIIDGRLGKDVEVRSTANGKKVVSFSVASDFGYGDNKGTKWHNVVAWGLQAEFAEKFLKKGSGVLVVGEHRERSYEDKTSGEKKYVTEIHADTIKFSWSKESSPENGQKTVGRTNNQESVTRSQATPSVRKVVDDPFADTGITDDDIPF